MAGSQLCAQKFRAFFNRDTETDRLRSASSSTPVQQLSELTKGLAGSENDDCLAGNADQILLFENDRNGAINYVIHGVAFVPIVDNRGAF